MPNLKDLAKNQGVIRTTVLVPIELQPRLKALADLEDRSVSKEIIFLIKQALKEKNL